MAPEVCLFVCPLENRGRREDRVLAAPAVSRARCAQRACTRAYRFSGSIPAFPAQWVDGLLRALPGERLSCLRRCTGREPHATWRQHRGIRTTRLRRTLHARPSCAPLASTASHRAFV